MLIYQHQNVCKETQAFPGYYKAPVMPGPGQQSCKPDSVPRLHGAPVIYLAPPSPVGSNDLPSGIGRAALKAA